MIRQDDSLVSVGALPTNKQLAFALLVLERMLPSLTAFSKDTGFDSACYLQARDAAWGSLQNSAVNRALMQTLNQACLRSAPDTQNFSHVLTSQALNAALAMSDIVEFTLDGRVDHIAHVSTLARDSVYLYLSGLEALTSPSPEEDNRIASHPLMRDEQRREEEDIKFLTDLPAELNESVTSLLKLRATKQAPLLPVAS